MPRVIDSENWRRHTACRGMNPEIFFMEDAGWATRVCGACPDACREFCLLEGFMLRDDGVRGGMTSVERERLHDVVLGYVPPEPRTHRRELTVDDIPPFILVRTRQIRPEQLDWFLKLYDDGWSMHRISVLFKFAYTAVRRVIVRERCA